jgi:uncharacterized protein (TIGR02231 family)
MSAIGMFVCVVLAVQDAPIREVTVFESGALVQRRATLAPDGTSFEFRGLPGELDREALRARAGRGLAVTGLEVSERFERRVPEARVEELREARIALQREIAAQQDELEVCGLLERHFERLLELPQAEPGSKPATGNVSNWLRHGAAVSEESARNLTQRRELTRQRDELRRELAELEQELGRVAAGETVPLVDVRVSLERTASDVVPEVALEYVVPGAGWRPRYELRTASDARSVELSYRAEVWQQTGEDWNEIELALSTARPHVGAEGPDPVAIWLGGQELVDVLSVARAGAKPGREIDLSGFAQDEKKAWDEPPTEATVEASGLSLRFRMAQKENVPSRPEPSVVLVGAQRLDVTPEYVCTPELDSSVWLRGRTHNTTPWMLLPGRVATYFGADFLGFSQLGAIPTGAELTLHLGPDPAFTLERVVLADVLEKPGLFSRNSTRKQSFRVRVANAGAAITGPDGTAEVLVREALPRTRDEDLEIALESSSPKPDQDAHSKRQRDESNIVTWRLRVPRGGEASVEWKVHTKSPEGVPVLER